MGEKPHSADDPHGRFIDLDDEGKPVMADSLELDSDESKLYSAVLGTFPPEELLDGAEALERTPCPGTIIRKMRWAAEDHSPVPVRFHNEPIGTLLKLFTNKKSKSVSYARTALRMRYPYQAFAVQKKILSTFLTSGTKSDATWVGKILMDSWIPGFEELVLSRWHDTRDRKLAFTIIRHFPAGTVIEESEALSAATHYAYVAARIGNEPGFTLDMSRLSVSDHLYVWAKLGRKMTEREAREMVLGFLSHLPDEYYRFWGIVPSDRMPQLTDIEGMGLIIWALGKMGLRETLLWILSVKRDLTKKLEKTDEPSRRAAMSATLRCLADPSLNPEKTLKEEKERLDYTHADEDDLPPSDPASLDFDEDIPF